MRSWPTQFPSVPSFTPIERATSAMAALLIDHHRHCVTPELWRDFEGRPPSTSASCWTWTPPIRGVRPTGGCSPGRPGRRGAGAPRTSGTVAVNRTVSLDMPLAEGTSSSVIAEPGQRVASQRSRPARIVAGSRSDRCISTGSIPSRWHTACRSAVHGTAHLPWRAWLSVSGSIRTSAPATASASRSRRRSSASTTTASPTSRSRAGPTSSTAPAAPALVGPSGTAAVPDGLVADVVESAEECPGECIFLEV